MDWMQGQSNMLAVLAKIILENVGAAGIPRTSLFILLADKTAVSGFNQIMGSLLHLGALHLGPSGATHYYVTRGPNYGTTRHKLKESTQGIYAAVKATHSHAE